MSNTAENAPLQLSDQKQWDRIADSEQFKDLLQIKKVFIIPAFVFFLVHYFALALLVGYAPKLASTRVVGTVTVAYLFALSQFVMGWIIAGLYVLASTRFDALTKDILASVVAYENERQGDK
jgi:uncharacterized membrane protein (DUF485 family)